MRKGCMLLLCLLLLLGAAVSAFADPVVWTDETTGHRAVIDDREGLLSENELETVLEAMKNVTAFCDTGFVTESGYGKASRLAEKWALSTFGSDDTVIFAIDMKARDLSIASQNAMRGRFTVQDANTVTDNQYKKATAGRYGDCAVGVFEEIGQVLRGEQIARPMKYISNALIALCLSVLICFLFVSSGLKRKNPTEAAIITAAAAAGTGTARLGRKLLRKVHHDSSSDSSGGGHGGGGHSGGGGGFSSGSHGF